MNENLVKLIKLAQGNRSQNIFSMQCEVNAATLTKIIKEERKPSPDTLKKLANKAQNGVTYKDLMIAAGHWDEEEAIYDSMLPDNNLSIGERIKRLRLKHGLTQEQLSEKLNLKKTDISKYESDNDEPGLDILKLLAEIFNVSVDYLLWLTNDPTPPEKKETKPMLGKAPVFVTLQRLQNQSEKLSDKERERMDRKLKTMFDEYFPEDDEE